MINDVISPEFDENGRALRRIRSFVRRQGRLTKGQQHALDNYWPVMGVEYQADAVDLAALFGRDAPTVLEISTSSAGVLPRLQKARLPARIHRASGVSRRSHDSHRRARASISRAKPENSSGLPRCAEIHSGISPRTGL